MLRRCLAFAVAATACVLAARALVAKPVHTIPPAVALALPPQVGGAVDPAFVWMVTSEQPARHILRSLAVDLDRDGDLDVIAATVEEPIVIWIRDETGRFTRHRPAAASHVASGQQLAALLATGGAPGETAPSKWRTPALLASPLTIPGLVVGRVRASDAFDLAAISPASRPSRGPPPARLA